MGVRSAKAFSLQYRPLITLYCKEGIFRLKKKLYKGAKIKLKSRTWSLGHLGAKIQSYKMIKPWSFFPQTETHCKIKLWGQSPYHGQLLSAK